MHRKGGKGRKGKGAQAMDLGAIGDEETGFVFALLHGEDFDERSLDSAMENSGPRGSPNADGSDGSSCTPGRVAAPTSVRACLKPSSGGTVRVGDRNRPPEASGMQQAAEKEPTDLMNEG